MFVHLVLAEDILVVLLGNVVIGARHNEVGGLPLLCHGRNGLGAGGRILAHDERLLLHVNELLDDGAGRLGLPEESSKDRASFLPLMPPLALISSAAIS